MASRLRQLAQRVPARRHLAARRRGVWLLGTGLAVAVAAGVTVAVAAMSNDARPVAETRPSADTGGNGDPSDQAQPGGTGASSAGAGSVSAHPSAGASSGGATSSTSRPRASDLPIPSSYPNGTNTGVPAGTTLTAVNGDVSLRTANQVYEGKDIHGCISVYAVNVTIRRSRVTCTSGYGIYNNSSGGLTVEDVEISCQDTGATAIGDRNLTVRRVNLHGCENGLDIDHDVTVVDSYIHDLRPGDSHQDGIQLAGGSHIVIQHNSILPGQQGSSAIISDPTDNADVLIEANLLGGGVYALYCPRDSSSNFRVINNRFSKLFWPKSGLYGPGAYCAAGKVADLRGNVWDDTGLPADLDQ